MYRMKKNCTSITSKQFFKKCPKIICCSHGLSVIIILLYSITISTWNKNFLRSNNCWIIYQSLPGYLAQD